MELRHLRYFIGVAEEENVTRASLKLHVSQPALSRQIATWKVELGFPLLDAAPIRAPDRSGPAFLIEARAVLQRVEDAVKTARSIATGGHGELHGRLCAIVDGTNFATDLARLSAELPNVRVRLHDFSTEEMLAGLREGNLQIAFVVRLAPALLRGLQFEELRAILCASPLRQNIPWQSDALSRWRRSRASRSSLTVAKIIPMPTKIWQPCLPSSKANRTSRRNTTASAA